MTIDLPIPTSPFRPVLAGLLTATLVLLGAGLVTACDQGSMNDDGDNFIAPNTSRVSFEVTPGTPDTTQQLTLTYTALDARPTPQDVPRHVLAARGHCELHREGDFRGQRSIRHHSTLRLGRIRR
jgi:hypothetical protein